MGEERLVLAPAPSGVDEIVKVFQLPGEPGRAPRSALADEGFAGEFPVAPVVVDGDCPS